MRAGMLDRMDLGRVGVDASLAIDDDGVVLPGPLPQFVDDL